MDRAIGRYIEEIEDERLLDLVVAGQLTDHSDPVGGRFVIGTFGEDPDPLSLIVDDGAPI